METALKIYTDGGCVGNPGPGGWAYIMVLQTFQGEKVIAQDLGGVRETTNNRMELTAALEALRALTAKSELPRHAVVLTDSQYVQKGMSEWIKAWKRNNWRTSSKTPVKNKDLWIELDTLAEELTLQWEWVPGHAGIEYNEKCDLMTQKAIASL